MLASMSRTLDQAKRLELGLVRVRWFGVVLGAYLVAQTNEVPPPHASDAVLIGGQSIMAYLAIGNVVVWYLTQRIGTTTGIQAVGLAAFLLDATAIIGLSWLFSYDPKGSTWVAIFILPLEGALRYQLEGALAAVGLAFCSELAREFYLAARFEQVTMSGGASVGPYPFLVSNVAFRVGIAAIGAMVAGFMARSLAREAQRASEQATRFQEAARRESLARAELAAFNTAILTGVAAEDLDVSLQLMAAAIGRDLGFETMTILLREGDELVVRGMYGMPFYEGRIPVGSGITGHVAQSGTSLVVGDVRSFPGYIVGDPDMRSEMAVAMRVGDDVIGVLDVESRQPDAFDEPALATLTRLADQIALVAHSNQLLSQQRQTVERLRELDQMKSDFVAITSHELRTPLTAIRGFVNTLIRNRDRISERQVVDFMHIIDRQTARLARLVEDMLLVSRIEAGTVRLHAEQVDLERFLGDVVDAFRPEDRARITLSVQADDEPVRIDPDRTDQVLRNLVDNALKFSPEDGPVAVTALVRDRSIHLTVSDRGLGIAPEQIPHIFERFHQAEDVLTREAEGAGLGLYITKRLVEAMGGTIEVRSRVGAGSTFSVTLPREVPDVLGSARLGSADDHLAGAAATVAPIGGAQGDRSAAPPETASG
jgi:signal transduction histidine kinase